MSEASEEFTELYNFVAIPAQKRQHALEELFGEGGEAGFKIARERGLIGEIRDSPIRSICWKVFLGVLPTSNDSDDDNDNGNDDANVSFTEVWQKEIQQQRVAYEKYKDELLIDPHKSEEIDLALNNPLSQAEDSPWQTFFQNQELQKEIQQDILRTYPEKEFFQKQETKTIMLNILFIWSKQHPQVSYKQGMHELLAPIIYVLDREKVPESEMTETDLACLLNDARYVEHDAYTLFANLMKLTEDWFMFSQNNKGEKQNPLEEPKMTPIVVKCKRIQNQLLKEKDPQLCAYLDDLQIEPQLYALRWIRLLFGREFHLEDVLIMWDALFAYDKKLTLVDYVCVAMLTYIRSQLLEMDYSSCMRRLFKYPPVEDVILFIEKAVALANPNIHKKLISKAEEEQVDTIPEKQEKDNFSLSKILDKPKAIDSAQEEINNLKEVQLHMGNRIERIVYILQNAILEGSMDTSESVIMSIAELKQIKDILGGLLPADTMPIIAEMASTNSTQPEVKK